jgi:hypothetical protein
VKDIHQKVSAPSRRRAVAPSVFAIAFVHLSQAEVLSAFHMAGRRSTQPLRHISGRKPRAAAASFWAL